MGEAGGRGVPAQRNACNPRRGAQLAGVVPKQPSVPDFNLRVIGPDDVWLLVDVLHPAVARCEDKAE
jgi:hypothetical protein